MSAWQGKQSVKWPTTGSCCMLTPGLQPTSWHPWHCVLKVIAVDHDCPGLWDDDKRKNGMINYWGGEPHLLLKKWKQFCVTPYTVWAYCPICYISWSSEKFSLPVYSKMRKNIPLKKVGFVWGFDWDLNKLLVTAFQAKHHHECCLVYLLLMHTEVVPDLESPRWDLPGFPHVGKPLKSVAK